MEGFPRFLALHRTNRGSRGSAEGRDWKKKGERWDGFVDKPIMIEVLFLVVCVDSVRRVNLALDGSLRSELQMGKRENEEKRGG
jgi:hypothetical protein